MATSKRKQTPTSRAGAKAGTAEQALMALLGQLDELGDGLNRITYTDPERKWVYKVNIRDAEKVQRQSCILVKDGIYSWWQCEHRHGESKRKDANLSEFEMVAKIKASTSPLKRLISNTTMYRVQRKPRGKRYTVLAQPFVPNVGEGEDYCWKCEDGISHRRCAYATNRKRLDDACAEFGIGDMHEDNYGTLRNGELRIFDLVAW